MKRKSKSWLEISKKALVHNVKEFRRIIGRKTLFCAVVKANAYGHGLKKVVGILKNTGIDWLAVDGLHEALIIKKLGVKKPILILGYLLLTDIKDAIKNNFSFVVYNPETLQKIVKLNLREKAKIHLKVETGLNRQGVQDEDLKKIGIFLKKYKKHFVFEGISMHFADIEDAKENDFARKQMNKFEKIYDFFEKEGINFKIKHAAASAATILYPETRFDMVRVGLGLYGLYPSATTEKKIKLEPVLTWKSVVAQVKEIGKGETVGYGRTWRAKKKTRIAVIPVGYYDGFDRKLGNSGRILINGKFAPVVGRICMNMFMVDVINIPNIKLEDEVVLIGKQGRNEITVEELAVKIGTINYEVVTRINSHE